MSLRLLLLSFGARLLLPAAPPHAAADSAPASGTSSAPPPPPRRRHRARWLATDPASRRSRRWDCAVLVALLYTATLTPVEVAFFVSAWPAVPPGGSPGAPVANGSGPAPLILRWTPGAVFAAFVWTANRVADVLFGLDLLWQLQLGYYRDVARVHLELRPARTAARYARTWLPLDAAATLPWELAFPTRLRALRGLTLLRLARAPRVLARFRGAAALRRAPVRLAATLALLFVLFHLVACGLQAVAAYEGAVCGWVHTLVNSKFGGFPCEPLQASPSAALVYTEALYYAVGHNPNQARAAGHSRGGLGRGPLRFVSFCSCRRSPPFPSRLLRTRS